MSAEDRAQAEELAMWEVNQKNSRIAEYKPGEPGYGPAFCQQWDCDEKISDIRRSMGKHFCVECSETKERLKKLGR